MSLHFVLRRQSCQQSAATAAAPEVPKNIYIGWNSCNINVKQAKKGELVVLWENSTLWKIFLDNENWVKTDEREIRKHPRRVH